MRGVVGSLQRFSVHDGPGIRTTVFLKGCPLRCRWCHNPELLRPEPELAFARDRCRRTRECANGEPAACPYGAYEKIGREVEAAALAEEAARDLPFFARSGGGVTFSGGEPAMQMEFVAEVARLLRARGVGSGLQTCGAFRWESFPPRLFAFVQYDLKLVDPVRHRASTGADNRVILENARRLVAAGEPVRFRMPVIPGHTDDEANLEAVAAFLDGLGIRTLQLLRGHAMGGLKNERVGRPLEPLRLDGADASLAKALGFFRGRIEATA